jgi:signal transduction histidine kinase
MKSPLHILHLEDDPNDASLIQSTLESEGIACATTRVQTREDFVAVLEYGGIDLVFSDFTMPAFDGLSATKIMRERWPELPIILVSGTLGEERAVDALKNGATDYVLKNRLARLAPSVRRAMKEVETQAERERLERQIIESQKMEVIGQLAAGVAHDFNNILAVIMGYSNLIIADLEPDSVVRRSAEEIRHASERAVGLTRQLLVFSRKQIVKLVVLDLNDVVKDLNSMLRRLIGEHVILTMNPGAELGRVKADVGYVGQVLMNLAVNARDAMPIGGKLTVTTKNVTLDENYTRKYKKVVPGEYVMLSVTDTGTGMSDEVKAHLFEPFFTTKAFGKGTGLGLSTCQTIVNQSGGHIDVESEVGHGTTFNVYFPRVEQPLEVTTQPVLTGPLPRGTETLLLVEDESSVRHLACNILELQGYSVLRANNGKDALRIVREHKGFPISLVVTDVIMPLMSGKVMAEWLKTVYPDLKILFTSGYTDDALSQHGVLEPGVEFLAKPYAPATLALRVRAMLDKETDTTVVRKQTVTGKQKHPGSAKKT